MMRGLPLACALSIVLWLIMAITISEAFGLSRSLSVYELPNSYCSEQEARRAVMRAVTIIRREIGLALHPHYYKPNKRKLVAKSLSCAGSLLLWCKPLLRGNALTLVLDKPDVYGDGSRYWYGLTTSKGCMIKGGGISQVAVQTKRSNGEPGGLYNTYAIVHELLHQLGVHDNPCCGLSDTGILYRIQKGERPKLTGYQRENALRCVGRG